MALHPGGDAERPSPWIHAGYKLHVVHLLEYHLALQLHLVSTVKLSKETATAIVAVILGSY